MNKTTYGKSYSSNYYYFDKLSKPQKGEIEPVRSSSHGSDKRKSYINVHDQKHKRNHRKNN